MITLCFGLDYKWNHWTVLTFVMFICNNGPVWFKYEHKSAFTKRCGNKHGQGENQ